MGGYVALAAAAEFVDNLAGIVVIDSPVPSPPPEQTLGPERATARPPRPYPSRESALARFRFVPEDPYVLPYLRDHVAAQSLRHDGQGWTWKFDAESLRRDRDFPVDVLSRIRCPVAIFRAEHGLITDDRAELMRAALGRPVPFVVLPGAGHHALLDEPIALLVGLRTVFECWDADRAEC